MKRSKPKVKEKKNEEENFDYSYFVGEVESKTKPGR